MQPVGVDQSYVICDFSMCVKSLHVYWIHLIRYILSELIDAAGRGRLVYHVIQRYT